jgi:intracellular sulfur oxidation DsrE/DsrF family protein
MHRRSIVAGAFSAVGTLFAAAMSAKPANAAAQDKAKVVYHLCDLDKVNFVLTNIRNHIEGMGGADKVTIALVVHGPALKAFHAANASTDLVHQVSEFSRAGLGLTACGNTMKVQSVTLKDLLPGFISADRGGVVRIAELQSSGYVYLRP